MNPEGDPKAIFKTAVPWVLLIIVILAGGIYWWDRVRENSEALPSGDKITTAPEGKTISNFPEELLLEPDAAVTESYSIEYKSGVDQPALTYYSQKSLAENVAMFDKYLRENNWAVLKAADPNAKRVTFFYAVRAKETLNVTFAPELDGKLKVIVGYAISS